MKKAVEEGGKVVLKQAQSNLNSVVGKGTKYDSRATGELERSLGLSPVKENGAGRDIKVGFSEPHSGGVSNAMVDTIFSAQFCASGDIDMATRRIAAVGIYRRRLKSAPGCY